MENITKRQTQCECGQVLDYRTTPFNSIEVRVCPNCGKHHNVDTDLIEWDKLKGTSYATTIRI